MSKTDVHRISQRHPREPTHIPRIIRTIRATRTTGARPYWMDASCRATSRALLKASLVQLAPATLSTFRPLSGLPSTTPLIALANSV